MEIPNLVTDTIANEVTYGPQQRRRPCRCTARSCATSGSTLTEIADLEKLAASCDEDKQYTFLYAAAPAEGAPGQRLPGQPRSSSSERPS